MDRNFKFLCPVLEIATSLRVEEGSLSHYLLLNINVNVLNMQETKKATLQHFMDASL